MDIKAKLTPEIRVGNKVIGNGEPVFVITEVAGSYEGSLQQAKMLLEVSQEVGTDARAVIREPEILIFDEATNNLDNISEVLMENRGAYWELYQSQAM